jgi:type IV secretory pathway VirB3-like protein
MDGADPVFLGLTRPAMFWGVTHSFFVINLIVCLIGFLAAHSWLPCFWQSLSTASDTWRVCPTLGCSI